jgi:hypothetical protein
MLHISGCQPTAYCFPDLQHSTAGTILPCHCIWLYQQQTTDKFAVGANGATYIPLSSWAQDRHHTTVAWYTGMHKIRLVWNLIMRFDETAPVYSPHK